MMSLVARRLAVASSTFAFVVVSSVVAPTQAQVDYYFNPPVGVDTINLVNTWDLANSYWNSVNLASPALPANDHLWANDGTERANFGNTAGTVTLSQPITAYGIDFNSTGYTIAGGGNVLTLAGPGGPINVNTGATGNATISAQIAGSNGLTVVGKNIPNGGNTVAGTLTLTAANTYSGSTTVTGATLVGNPQASGSPFSSGAVTLNGGTLNLKAASAGASSPTTVGNLTIGGTTATNVGSSQLIVDDQANSPSVTLAAGNLVRGGPGSALVVTPNTGSLGNKENITFANGSGLVTNGILPPWVVTTASGADLTADFVTYGSGPVAGDYNGNGTVDAADYVNWRKNPAGNGGNPAGYNTWRGNFGATGGGSGNGLSKFTSYATDLSTSTNTSVVDQATAPTISGNVAAYALKTNQAINLAGNTLTLGNGSGQSGLILNNGGSISGGNIALGPTEGVIFSQGTTTLGSAGNTITSNGLTITGSGATSLTINGNIVDGTAPAKLNITESTALSNITLNGNNSYSGGTTLAINSQSGSASIITVGSDTAFGAGKVTNILLPGSSAPQFQATGADRTLANPFDLNGAFNFTGTQSITFTGAMNVIQAQVGGTRNMANNTTGKTITYGSSVSPSTITLGNPVSNGGDGLGTTLIISSNSATNTNIINDVMVDPSASSGGMAQYSGAGTTRINSQNTYSGGTNLNGTTAIQVNANSTPTAGPFGTGMIFTNSGTPNNIVPYGADRTIPNPFTMVAGITVANSTDPGETARNLTLTGPIQLNSTQGRTINNSMTGGTLTIGDPNAPTTITGNASPNTAQSLSFTVTNAASSMTVNDAIQDSPGSGIGTPLAIPNTAKGNITFNGVISTAGGFTINTTGGTNAAPSPAITFNAQNTYTGTTTISGPGVLIPLTESSNALPNAGFSSGPFGTSVIEPTSSTNAHFRPAASPAGGGIQDRMIANDFKLTRGVAMDNATGDSHNVTFAGNITMINAGRSISNGFSGIGANGGTMILGDPSAPSTITMATAATSSLALHAIIGPIVVNDVMQDASGFAGQLEINGNANDNNPVTLNAASTFTGAANLGGGSAAASGQARLGISTDGDFGAINSGPLGRGTIVAVSSNATNTPPLTPFNADRTLSNAVNITGHLATANAPSESFNLNLTGPISVTAAADRQLNNNMSGTLTLGKSTVVDSTQPITLSGTAGVTLTFAGGASSTTVVNDAIQNGGSGFIPGLVAVSGSTVRFNNDNSYGPTSPGTTTNTTVSGGTLLVNNTSGSGTGSGNVAVTGGTLGGTGIISQSVSASGGAIAPGDGGAGTLNISTNVTFSGTAGLTVELGGTTPGVNFDQLLVGGVADVSAASNGTLTVSLINGFNPSVDTDFTILTAAGGLTTNAGVGFGNFAYPDFTHWTTNYTANSVVVHYSAAGGSGSSFAGSVVPEPGALALLVCAVGCALFASLRRGGHGRR